ncbi:MAG: DUF4158 domain-containing protein [Desulfuromonadales bacterium]
MSFLRFFNLQNSPCRIERIGFVASIAAQIGVPIEAWHALNWEGRTIKRYRADIREWCGFREVTLSALENFRRWLVEEIIPQVNRADSVREALAQKCRELRIELPAADHTNRLIQSAFQEHESDFCETLVHNLNFTTLQRLDALLQLQYSVGEETEWTAWQTLKSNPGKAGLESVQGAVARLLTVREIGLPDIIFKSASLKLIERYAKRAAVEEPFELRRHTVHLRATLMAAFLHLRREELTEHFHGRDRPAAEYQHETIHVLT